MGRVPRGDALVSGVLYRWAGSKNRILPELMAHLDVGAKYQRWVEPFLGGGSAELEAMRRGLAQDPVAIDAQLAAINAGGPAAAVDPKGWSTQQWLRFLNGIDRRQTPARLSFGLTIPRSVRNSSNEQRQRRKA